MLPGAGKAAGQAYEPEKTKQEPYALTAGLYKEKIGLSNRWGAVHGWIARVE